MLGDAAAKSVIEIMRERRNYTNVEMAIAKERTVITLMAHVECLVLIGISSQIEPCMEHSRFYGPEGHFLGTAQQLQGGESRFQGRVDGHVYRDIRFSARIPELGRGLRKEKSVGDESDV